MFWAEDENMQLGNKNYIKDSIKNYYLDKLKEFNSEIQQKEKEIQQKVANEIKLLREKALLNLQKELATIKASTLNEEKLKVKREFEMERERLIEEVIQNLKKKFPEIAKSEKYLKFVKSQMPKEYEYAIVSNGKLKNCFKKAKVGKGFNGVKFITKDATIDFSLERILEIKIDSLREAIVKGVLS